MSIDAEIKKITPEESDIIIVTVKERVSQQELQEILDKTNEAFPNNNVVIMPEHLDIENVDGSDLQEAIEMLHKLQRQMTEDK